MSKPNYSFAAIVTVFFFWGFLAASNGIFIPFCKAHFHLSQFQSQLVDSAFYGAYFIGSLLLYIFSLQMNTDIINAIGFRRTIIYGLFLSVAGALLMIPALGSESFTYILLAFFVIALGFSFQQTSANPLVLNIGDPARGSHRLNLAGSINSLGTTIGPILVSMALFGKAITGSAERESASAGAVQLLYVILAAAFVIAALVLGRARIPRLDIEQGGEGMKILKAPLVIVLCVLLLLVLLMVGFAAGSLHNSEGEFIFLICFALLLAILGIILLLQYRSLSAKNRVEERSFPQLSWGMFAIFVYVGVEVTIQSNLGALLKTGAHGALADSQISPFISLYWGSLMIGRWTGSIAVFRLSRMMRIILTVVVPFVALSLVLFMNTLSGAAPGAFIGYMACIAFLVIAFFASGQKPAFTLILFSILGLVAMLIGLYSSGQVSNFAFLSGGLFCSIMWPCIFSLATAGLGNYTSQASAFLIMMVLGGAFIPPLQGFIADRTDIHLSYWIPAVCFAILTFYAFRVRGMLRQMGIDYDGNMETTH